MSEGEVAKPEPAHAPEKKAAAVADSAQEQTRSRLTAEAGLSGPPKGPNGQGDGQRGGSDDLRLANGEQDRSPFHDLIKEMYGPRAGARRAERGGNADDLVFEPIAGFDPKRPEGGADRIRLAAHRPEQAQVTGPRELAHGDKSRIVKDGSGAVSDQGDVNGTHYDITASKDKDAIVWKDKDGKEHRFERTKGENRNEYVDGDGTKLVQNGDTNTITYKEGIQVQIDARTGRTIIQRDQKEIAQYNGKDAVRRQLDDNNVAFQVRGDVAGTVDQIREYQSRTGQPQKGNMIIKNEKGDTVILQQDGTEISRKADSPLVTIKRGDTVVEYTPGQAPKVVSGEQHVTHNNGGLQIDGQEMLTKDGTVAISGMTDGRLDSRFGRIYGTTVNGGQIDLGTGRAIADRLTTVNTGSGVEATTDKGTVVLKTGPDGKQIQSGPVTTNVDADHPTTVVKGTDGSTINIDNTNGASNVLDSSGTQIAGINDKGDMCTWDGTYLGADGNIFNSDMDFSGFTSYAADDSSGYGYSGGGDDTPREGTTSVESNCNSAVVAADAICADATALANNLNASPSTLGQIDAGIGTLASFQAQAQALLPFNPNLADELARINQAWSNLEGVRARVQNEVAVQEALKSNYGITTKGVVASAIELGGTPQALELAAQPYRLPQSA